MSKAASLRVQLSNKAYEIRIGSNVIEEFPGRLAQIKPGSQVLLVSNEEVYKYYGAGIKEQLIHCELEVLVYLLPDGEEYKSWQQAEDVLKTLLEEGFNRDAVIVALGGGVIGDLAGFVASIYQRGIDFVQLPTTLLAQVDSSVGGKVAVNHPLGKNMIGAFHQPIGVWADPNTLKTLPHREWTAGLAEVVKYGVIWDEAFFELLEKNITGIRNRDLDLANQLIVRSCEIKAGIVAQDEKEQGIRAILNFGHTIGHALEKVTAYKFYRHGEAVAIGMALEAKIANDLGMCSGETVRRLERLLGELGLPLGLPDVVPEDIFESLYLDKKVRNKELVFILPKKIGQAEIVKGVMPQVVKKFLRVN